MKLRDLELHLRKHGAALAREGSKHTVWTSDNGQAAVPRHKEVKSTVARSICRLLEVPDPPSG